MSLSRRKTLLLLGGGAVAAAVSGTAAFVGTRTPTQALMPWDAAGGYDDPRKFALSYALLAPNPHNRQPWVAELVDDDGIRLFRDPDKNLPATDPFDRQLTIGMGCFLELLSQAASERGLTADITLFPEGDGDWKPVADIRMVSGANPDPLFTHVHLRRSCKEPFDMAQPVADAQITALGQRMTGPVVFEGTTAGARVDTLRTIAKDAWTIEAMTPATWGESVDLLRIGKPEIEANPDGIDLGSPLLEVLRRTGMLGREALMDTSSGGFTSTMDRYMATFNATPAFVWLKTAGNSRADQIAAGRAWVRLNLATTADGLSLHPVSQALQEFDEMSDPYARIHAELAKPGETVQMLGRLGYGPIIPKTPRWPLEAKLQNG